MSSCCHDDAWQCRSQVNFFFSEHTAYSVFKVLQAWAPRKKKNKKNNLKKYIFHKVPVKPGHGVVLMMMQIYEFNATPSSQSESV